MHYLYNFDFNCLFEAKILNKYINYKIESFKLTQKEIVKKTKITQPTLTRAKKNGYKSKPWVYQILLDYLNVKEADENLVHELEEVANSLYTAIYYKKENLQEELRHKLILMHDLVVNTNLEIIYYALCIIASEAKSFINFSFISEQIKLLEIFIVDLNPELKFLVCYALCHYYFLLNSKDNIVKYTEILYKIVPLLPKELSVFANFVVMKASFYNNNKERGIALAEKVLDAQLCNFSLPIRIATVYELFLFYKLSRNYQKIVEIAKCEVTCLQFSLHYQTYYLSYLTGYNFASIMLGDYNKAKEINAVLNAYDVSSIKNVEYSLTFSKAVNILNALMLFVYYKEKDENNYERTKNIVVLDKDALDIYAAVSTLKEGGKVAKKKMKAKLENDDFVKSLGILVDIFALVMAEYNAVLNKKNS